ncbi:MAG TPA: hypothetical protein VKL21_04975 [Candidatus Methanoperedens sp.]|nr:hypothetical protein [Candidatus Methanoperedens sp.]
MMVEKLGGKTKDTGMVKFSFSICSRDIGNDNCEALAKMFFLQGASSKPGLLQISDSRIEHNNTNIKTKKRISKA